MRKTVVITGVAGGVGFATARLFAEKQWRVIGLDVRRTRKSAEIEHFIRTDISDISQLDSVRRTIAGLTNRLDALVNNAAIQICKPILETTVEDWDAVFGVNVRAIFRLTQILFPLLKRAHGSVINVSSVHAIATSAGVSAYAASKGALLPLTRAMALEFSRYHVRVNAVLPGAVDTQMLRSGLERGHLRGASTRTLLQSLAAKHALGRVGKPRDIAHAIYFLGDPEHSSFITGQTLVADGGAMAKLSTE